MKSFVYDDTKYYFQIENNENDSIKSFNNNQAQKLTAFLKCNFPNILNGMDYNIVFYDDEDFNAGSFIKNKNAYIAFPKSFFSKTLNLIKYVFSRDAIDKVFKFSEVRDKEYFINAIFEYITYFIVLHELSHIARGHCTYLNKQGIKFSMKIDQSLQEHEEESFLLQTLELDADSSAIEYLLNYLMHLHNDDVKAGNKSWEDLSPLLAELRILSFSIYFLFIILNISDDNIGNELKLYLENLSWSSHPFPSLRMNNISTKILVYMSRILTAEEQQFYCHYMTKECITFDNIFIAHGNFCDSLVAVASTKKGALHLQQLYQNWNNIREELQEFSFVKLENNDIPKSMPYWVDEKGNMSKIMFQTEKIKSK
ncbi:hypothetical protein MSI_26290 [Treponema sp. JC4]|uniref:hypothetical protein n=1 Tax=Treponema sp. JC4 TaxID=1124982 RepID=UPI00025B0B24|nr:hypothetical protein [Treponema sp. JC4]EID83962.1 hypothetical protein MSI_26290 [Treponema sp. JC4]